MYTFPEDFDPRTLVDLTIVELTFTENTIRFTLDPNASITALGELTYEGSLEDGSQWSTNIVVPVAQSNLMQLMGSKITDARVEDRATLALTLSNGHALKFVENTDQYECYWLQIGEAEIII